MKEFMDCDFLLTNDVGKVLYENYAELMPIIDYHCHIEAKEIAEDKHWDNITQLWLYADHYKWRAMRACGISERLITGDADDYDKFEAYCSIMPSLIGNPLYHWSHLELQRYFGYEGIISPKTCAEIWNLTKQVLARPDMGARGIIAKSNVSLLCTTNDPIDPLKYHLELKEDKDFETVVLPAFRPDKAMKIEYDGFAKYIKELSEFTNVEIKTYSQLKSVLKNRMEYFNVLGCRTADHGMDDTVLFDSRVSAQSADSAAEIIFKRAVNGESIDKETARIYRSSLIRFLCKEYVEFGWVMQIHFGALRNVSDASFAQLGPDSGFDMIHGSGDRVASCASMLNALESESILPKTIIYSLNPSDNASVATLVGSFQRVGDELEGMTCMPKMQQGAAWWFNDHYEGIREWLKTYSSQQALGKFVGMLTDSRSFLSYTRHEYFRRILCSYLGELVESGMYPLDMDALAQIVCDVCYNNAKDFFEFRIM